MNEVAVFAGDFTSQPLAFAHLLDAAEARGLALDLDHVEVIQGDPVPRLTHALGEAGAALAEKAPGETLVLIFPEALIPGARLFERTQMLRPIGSAQPARERCLK